MPDRMPRAAGEAKPRRSRLLLVGLPVFAVFAAFGVIVWLAYQENARVPTGEPPLISAIAAPYKLAPDDPGGRQVADQGEINELLRDEPGPTQPERVLPLPEEPRAPIVSAARPDPAELQTPAAPAEADGQAAPASIASSDQAQSALPPQNADAEREAEAALARLLADVGPGASLAERPAVAEPAAAADSGVAVPTRRPAPPPSTTAPTIVVGDAPRVAAPVDVPSREADEALARLLAEVSGIPVDAAPEPASAPSRALAAMAPTDPPIPQRAMGPGFRVQLAAVREQDDARRAWSDLVDRLGSLVADRQPFYERAETANGVFYRIQLGPFASEQTADRLCLEVQQRNASCFVVAP